MPPRRQPPAPQGESKTGLVVALIFFILTSLAFGVVAYLFYDESKQAASKEKEARDAAANAKKDADEQQVARIIYAGYLGTITEKDISLLVNLQKHPNYDTTLGALNEKYKSVGINWDPNTSRSTPTCDERIRKLVEENTSYAQKLKAAEDAAKAAADDYVSKIGIEEAGKLAAQKGQKTANEAEVKAKADKSAELLAAFKAIEDVREELANLKNTMHTKDIDARKQIAALQKTIDEKDTKLKKILEELESKREALFSDKPHGRIVRVDNRNGIAWINIGSADFVRPQLTFSVSAPNTAGISGRRDRKGAVEVTRVLEEHLSQVKIVDVTNATQDPILVGDQIFNPAWDPSRQIRVAITGHIDFNGDGFDDTSELVRNLQKIGMIVDSWLDLKEIKIEGPGITGITEYLILGDSPQSDAGLGGLTIDNREERKGKIREKMEEMVSSAKAKGVEIVQWRRFLSRIGYPIAKSTQPPEFNPPGTLRQKLSGDAKSDDKKDDKKDEGK